MVRLSLEINFGGWCGAGGKNRERAWCCRLSVCERAIESQQNFPRWGKFCVPAEHLHKIYFLLKNYFFRFMEIASFAAFAMCFGVRPKYSNNSSGSPETPNLSWIPIIFIGTGHS